MSHQVITKVDIDAALNAGKDVVELSPTAIVTSLAKEYAQARGVRLVSASAGAAPTPAEVRQAVIDRLGHAPDGLEDAIAKVMGA